jgi:hypothetical protein
MAQGITFSMTCNECKKEFTLVGTVEQAEKAVCPECESEDTKTNYMSFPTDGPGFSKGYDGTFESLLKQGNRDKDVKINFNFQNFEGSDCGCSPTDCGSCKFACTDDKKEQPEE